VSCFNTNAAVPSIDDGDDVGVAESCKFSVRRNESGFKRCHGLTHLPTVSDDDVFIRESFHAIPEFIPVIQPYHLY